jgi:hypothetical protein
VIQTSRAVRVGEIEPHDGRADAAAQTDFDVVFGVELETAAQGDVREKEIGPPLASHAKIRRRDAGLEAPPNLVGVPEASARPEPALVPVAVDAGLGERECTAHRGRNAMLAGRVFVGTRGSRSEK